VAGARQLTELEGCVLGLLKLRGPRTPYAIRREFLASPTPHWSGSAGAIYPLVGRLAKRGLVRAARGTGDGRGGTLYALTAAGGRALRGWLGPPLSPLTLGLPPDPIRTRVGFLGLLPEEERRSFLAAAEEDLRRQLAEALPPADDPFERWAARALYLMREARLAWVREMAEALAANAADTSAR
jgi:DNA-binding PadR family transcriptional regulator